MKIILNRMFSNENETIGVLTTESGEFLAYTLEDEHRDEKVMHETRIPSGTYKIALRTEGRIHAKYSDRYPDFHKGMFELQDVPNFTYILIHQGNDDGDTSGCILVGAGLRFNSSTGKHTIAFGQSSVAYKYVYNKLIGEIEDLEIEVIDKDLS